MPETHSLRTSGGSCSTESNYFVSRHQDEHTPKCSVAFTCSNSAIEMVDRQSLTIKWRQPSLQLDVPIDSPTTSVKVDLASPEEINLESESLKADFQAYGTTV